VETVLSSNSISSYSSNRKFVLGTILSIYLIVLNQKQDFQDKAPLLYFWYTEVEMASNSESSAQRALHILSCLGSNAKYTPFSSPVSGSQILRVRQGFKEQIKSLRPEWARGYVKESAVALVCSASLFETITSGFSCGLEIIEEAFSMVLPGGCFSFLENWNEVPMVHLNCRKYTILVI
jgi:hypothetical protein